jgi:hypothetical protein
LRLDAGQAKYFDLADTASREHPSYVLAADAAVRASRKPKAIESAANANAAADKGAVKEASVDAINQQLQRIEDLRRKFEREDSLILELAPAVEVSGTERVGEPPAAPIVGKSKKRLAIISGGVAAAAALLASVWWLVHGF